MGIWQKIKSTVKKWLGGSSSSSKKSNSKTTTKKAPPKPRVQYSNPQARSQTVSSRTVSRGGNRVLVDVDDKKEEKRVADAFKAKSREYADTAAAIKKPKQSPYERQAEASTKAKRDIVEAFKKNATPDPKEAARKASRERLQKRLKEGGERHRENLETLNAERIARKEKRQKEREDFHKETGNKYNTKTGNEEHDRKAYALRVGGYGNASPEVQKHSVKYHPIITSGARGMANAATLGTTDLAIRKLAKNDKEREEAEEYYQKHKSRGAETVGSLIGGMATYGSTAGAFEKLGAKAVGRAAETQVGKRLGAEALKRTMAGTGAKAAIARSLVGDAIQDSTMGLYDTIAGVAARDDLKTPSDYAKAIAQGQAINYGMGLAGNAVAHGLPVATRAIGRRWGDFADESRKLRFMSKDAMDFMNDFVNDTMSGTRRNLIMNGGTTRASRLQGVQFENGFRPKKLGREKVVPPSANPQVVRKPSEVLQGYSSTGSKKKISDAQKRIKQFIADGDTKAARAEVERAVDEILRDTKQVVPMDDTIKEIKEELRNTRISIGDKADRADVGYKSGSFNEFRKNNFNAFKLTEDGTPVDDVWMSLQERYGTSLFPEEIENPSDQLQFLAEIAKTTDDKIDLADDELLYLRNELRSSLWESANKEAPKAGVAPTAEQPKARKRKPSKSETRLEEVRAKIKELDADIERRKAAGEDNIEQIREALSLRDEAKRLEKNVKKAEKAREKRATDKAMERLETELEAERARLQEEYDALEKKVERATTPTDETSKYYSRMDELESQLDDIERTIEAAKKPSGKKPPKKTEGNPEEEVFGADKEGWSWGRTKDGDLFVGTDRERDFYPDTPENRKFVEDYWKTNSFAPKVKVAKKVAKNVEPSKAKMGESAVTAKSDIVATGEGAKTGEQAKVGEEARTGERTEFKRNEEPSAKEKARNKRTEKRAKATQEGFDRDFAEFVKKVEENREKVSQLNGRLRAAATAEEKQAIRDEIKALDDEIKTLHRKASLRYHPDMGGTNEWAQKFNTVYDSYTKRVYSSPNFSGASSKSSASGGGTRNNTYRDYRNTYRRADAGNGGSTPPPRSGAGNGAGNGGNTPPPPRGGQYADYDGLRRPRGYARRTQRAMHSAEDMVGATRESETWRGAFRMFRDEANRKFVDSLKDFEGIARDLKKTRGKEAMQKLYGAIDKARRYKAVASTSVGSHQMKWDGTRYQVKGADGVMRDAPSVAEIFSGMDRDKERSFNAYLFLKHNVDRLREGKPIFDNTVIYNGELSRRLGLPLDIDLMDADVCKKLAQDYELRFSDFQERAAQIRQYTANELNNRVHAGLLSKETMDEWLHKYPNYVPTYRAGLFDGVSAVRGASVSPSDLRAAKGSDLNIYDLKEQLADATARNWRDITLNNLLEKTFGENVARNLGDIAGNIEGAHTLVLDHTMNVGKVANGGGYFAVVYRDGEAVRMPIEKRFYDDIKDLYANGRMGNGLDVLNDKILTPLANVWKKLITEWSPIFMVKNFMRDYPEAIINSRSRKEFLAITADGSALKDLLSGGQFSTSLRDAGISASTFIDIDAAVKAFDRGEGGLRTLIPRLNAGVEMYPRLVEYMATIKKAGYDLKTVKIADIPMEIRDMAAANAADVTVNFGRSGSIGKMINKGAIPFFNPSVQGWSKFARNVTELDGFKDTVGFLLSATALGAAPMVATNLLYHNNPNYQQISARDKANNYIIAIPPLDDNADKFIKIPRSRFASVYGLPLVNVANENKASWATAIQIVNDQVAPLNPLESHLGANLIQAARNKTWYGTPIESESMKTLPANERYDATTSNISIGAAQALDKATKGKVKVSPKKLDYVLDANLGVVSDFALPLTTKSKQEGNVLTQIGNVGKKAFTIDSTTQNDLSSRYYDQATLLEQNKNSSKATETDRVAYKKFNSWNNRIKSVTGAMRYIQASDLPNKQDAYRELAKLRNENMQKALDGKYSVNNTKDIRIIHKYAGTSYTIENLGKSADQKALKAYSAAVYGNLSDEAMKKKIDSDTEFYKGYEGIVKTQNALQKANIKLKGDNALTYAVGLANAGADDNVFAAYGTTLKSRTESASKAQRAKDYFKNSGSVEEFAQLENAVKTLGKIPDVDKDRLEDDAYSKLKRGEISIDDYNTELKKISYNANLSYVGKSVSLALSGAPARAYNLYDIKERNVQKGYNLAAMGIDSRKYREMSQACDKDGNGYLKVAEIRSYVEKSDIEDKATLFDALCYYANVRNPFGTPNRYTAEQAAAMGKSRGIAQINVNAGADNTVFNKDKSNSSGWGGYRRGYGGWRHYGHRGGRGAKVKALKQSNFKATKRTYKDTAAMLKSKSSRSKGVSTASPVKIEPPKVKFKKYDV